MKKIVWLFILLFLGLNVYATDEWDKSDPAGTENVSDIDTLIQANNEAVDRLLGNYRQGVVLKYKDTASLYVTSGTITCSNAAGSLRKYRQNTSDADATTFTVAISANSSTPSGATYYKKIGSFYNNASSDISLLENDNFYLNLGARESKTEDVVYQAPYDGLITAFANITGSGQNLTMAIGSQNPPTDFTISDGGSNSGTYASVALGVRKGEYYECTSHPNTTTIYYQPLEDD